MKFTNANGNIGRIHIPYQFIRVMRIIIIIITVCLMQVHASTKAQISLNENRAKLETILTNIKKQTGTSFLYNIYSLKDAKPVTIKVKNASLIDVLQICFESQPFSYKIENNTVIIVSQENKQREPIALSFTKITGIVKDATGGNLPNVSVLNKTTGKGVSTDVNGAYAIDANEGDILVFSFIGFVKYEIVVGTTTRIDVVLKEENSVLDQVVVTALGIKKSTRTLTYDVQEVKGEELTRNKEANFVNALAGKVAGVTINPSSSGIGGASRVIMRGVKSISGNNNVLYVVDGIPIPNTNGGTVSGPFAGVTSGEGISSINPEDIESISALTGPSATALYGNQGANGVIVVTTKKGTAGSVKINITNSTDFFSPFVMPEFQNTYGQATDADMESWGEKLTTPSSYQPKDFFQTGSNVFNSFSLSGGTEKSQTFFSGGLNNAKGIIRKNEYNRYNLNLRHTNNITEKLTLDFGAMYAKMDDRNMIAQGQYHNPLVPIYLFPPGDDIKKYEVYRRYNPDRKVSTQFWPFENQGLGMQNPYWITDAQSNLNNTSRYVLNATAKYKVLAWLDVVARARMDHSLFENEVKRPAGTDGIFASEFGYYTKGRTIAKNTYLDLIASIRQNINKDLSINGNVGASYQNDKSDGLAAGGKLVSLANFYSVAENTSNLPTQSFRHTQLQSLFATAEFDYKKLLYLNATGRYELPSQLSVANVKSYFYPSIGVSTILTDVVNLPKNLISFAKIRFSYAEVGTPPNREEETYSIINLGAIRPAEFPEFQPERTKSLEAGVELKFLNNKLSLNGTVYKSNTVNQLLSQPLTGSIFTEFYYNAGDIENKGIEASIGYNTNTEKFNWSTTAIFTLNRNKVKRLSEGYQNPFTKEIFGRDSTLKSGIGDLQNLLAVGGTTADLYISKALREDNQGFLWVDPANNKIESVTIPSRFVGRTTPDYTIGWRNNFSYKNFSVSFLVDARVGGIGVSYTQAVMDAYGVSQKSADDRDKGGVDIYGKVYSDVQTFNKLVGGASGGSVGMAGYYIYSATNVRLREAAIGYTIPAKYFNDKVSNLKISITGRNLFMFYNKSPFDPESTSSTGTYDQGIDYFRQPSYRSFGFSVSAQF